MSRQSFWKSLFNQGRKNANPRQSSWRRQLCLEHLEDRIVPADVVWDGGASTANWHDASNWNPDGVPAATDNVSIGSGITVNYTSGTRTINSLTSAGTLTITGGSLTLTADSNITGGVLNQSGGILAGTGTLTVGSVMTWSGGEMSGSGTTRINGVLNISGTLNKSLNNGRHLDVAGQAYWTGTGNLGVDNGATLAVLSNGLLELQNSQSMSVNFASAALINQGTLRKSSSGTSDISLSFQNGGTVEVIAGTLRLLAAATGTSTGTFDVANNATLTVQSNHTFTNAEPFTGTGTVTIAGGTSTFSALTTSINTPTLNLSGGILAGTGTVTVDAVLNWSAGTMSGTGTTRINNVLNITGTLNKDLQGGRKLDVAGQANLSSTGTLSVEGIGAALTVLPGGVFEVQSNQTIDTNSTGVLINQGTLRKISTGTTTLRLAFQNASTVALNAGTLLLSANATGTSTGQFNVASGTTLTVSSNHTFAHAEPFTGTGAVTINGTATFSAPTTSIATPTVNLNGTLAGTGTVIVDALLNWTGGTMSGSGTTRINNRLNISGTFIASMHTGRKLDVAGQAYWSSTNTLQMDNGAVLTVLPGGLLELQSNQFLNTSSTASLINQGTLRKIGTNSTSTSNISVTARNQGTIEALTGELRFNNAFNSLSGTTLTEGSYLMQATLRLPSADIRTNNGNITLDGLTSAFLSTSGSNALANFNTNNGSFTLKNGRDFTTVGAFTNTGSLSLSAASTLAVTGNYTQTTGSLSTELGGTAVGSFGQIQATGTASNLAGGLNISLANGFQPVVNNTFAIITAASTTGNNFSPITGQIIPNNLRLDPQYNANNVTLKAVEINVPPTITKNLAQVTVNEGQTATNGGTYADANGDVVTIAANVGNVTYSNGNWSWSQATSDGPNTQTVTITATDSHGAASFITFDLTVNNVAPTIALTGSSHVNEGSAYTLNLGAITDPGADSVSAYTIHWGDGTEENFSGNPANSAREHTYADGLNTYTISVDLVDEDGTFTNAGGLTVTVDNVAPGVLYDFDVTVLEGQTATNSGNWGDPGADTVELSASIGTIIKDANGPGTWSWSFNTNDGPIQSQEVIITALDSDGATGTATFPLTVTNVAPTIALSGNNRVDEGSPYTLTLGTTTDPGADSVSAYTIHWGDGMVENFTGNPANSAREHTYADGPADYTITVDLEDEDGTFTAAGSLSIAVDNVAPTVALSGNSHVDEGSLYTLTLGAVTDPGADSVSAYTIHWGDGAFESITGNPANTTANHTYADGPANYTITVDLEDEDGTFTAAGSLSISVDNVAPTIALSGNSHVQEGSPYTLTLGTVADPGIDAVSSYTIHWGDGTVESFLGNPATTTRQHTYADGHYTYTISVDLVDEDGTFANAGSLSVTVDNVAPGVLYDFDVAVLEGLTATNSGNWGDPGADTVELSASIGTIIKDANGPGTWSWSFDTSDGPTQSQYVIITALDSDGATGTATFPLTVTNVAPTIALSGNNRVDEGSPYTLNLGTITDPGVDSVGVYTIHWGDGSVQNFTGNPANTTRQHIYADGPNTYTISVDLVDEDGTFANAGSLSVTVNNVAPGVLYDFDVAVLEGLTATNSGNWGDPGADTVELSATIGTIIMDANGPGTWSWSFDTSDGPDQTQDVTITATDSDGAQTSISFPLIVDNVAPMIVLTGNGNVAEGSSYTLTLGDVFDPGSDTVSAYSIHWGDGNTDNFTGSPANTTATHTYADGPHSYTITVDLIDEDGTYVDAGRTFSDDGRLKVTVTNIAPTIALSGNSNVNEGSPYTLHLGAVTDPGADTVVVYRIHWGDGAISVSSGNPANVTRNHIYADGPNSYLITVDLIDEDGLHVGGSLAVTVDNVTPSVSNAGNVTVAEGEIARNSGIWSDPGQDVVSLTASVGTITKRANGTWGWTFDTSDGPDQTQDVTITATDSDGASTSTTFQLSVANVAPSVLYNGDVTVSEGQTASTIGFWDDPGDDSVTLSVSVGTITQNSDGTWSWSFNTNDGPLQSQDVTITALDSDGATGTATFRLTVNNVAPTATISGPANGVFGQVRTFTLSANDPSPVDQASNFTYQIDWNGDAVVDETLTGIASLSVPHTYYTAGTYTVRVTATDKDGGISSTATHNLTISTFATQGNDVAVGGTNGNDNFVVDPGPSSGQVKITLNGTLVGTFNPTGAVLLFGGAGTDTLTVNGTGSADSFGIDVSSVVWTTWSNRTVVGDSVESRQLNGLGGADAFAVLSVGALAIGIDGGAGNDTLSGANRTNTWAIGSTGSNNAGTLNTALTFNNVESISGGTGADTFTFSDGRSVTQSVAGGLGNDTLNYAAYTSVIAVNLQSGAATGTGGVSGIDNLIGGTSIDRLTGTNAANVWNITGANAGNLNGGFTFSAVEDLTGGSQDDTFSVSPTGSLRGDVLGSAGTNTLLAADGVNTWNLNGIDSGTLLANAVRILGFVNVQNLTGGAAADTFNFGPNFRITETITGNGGHDILNYGSYTNPVSANLETRRATSNGAIITKTFSGIEEIVAGITATDTIIGANVDNTWNVTGANSGSVAGIAFSAVELLTGGTANDTFAFYPGASVAGTVDGKTGSDTLDYSNRTASVTVNLESNTATATGRFAGIEGMKGGSGADTLIGNNAATTWTLSGPFAGSMPSFTFEAVETLSGGTDTDTLVGTSAATAWHVTGAAQGYLSGSVGFTGMENLTGGGGNDTFSFLPGGSISGRVQGSAGVDTLNYSAYLTSVTLDRVDKSAPGLGDFQNIEDVVGGAAVDALTSNGAEWTVTGSGTGNIDGAFTFASFEYLDAQVAATLSYAGFSGGVTVDLGAEEATGLFGFAGFDTFTGSGNADTLIGPEASATWKLTGSNAGKITSVDGYDFTGFEHLQGGISEDKFVLANFALDGSVNGGGGLNTLDYTNRSTAVTVNLILETASGVGGAVSNVRNVTGGDAADTLIGNGLANTLKGGDGNDVLLGGGGRDKLLGENGRDLLLGGSGQDKLRGGAADDLLLGGLATFFNELGGTLDQVAVDAIMSATAWNSTATYDNRVAQLRLSGLAPGVVSDDGAIDALYGETGNDWFLVSPLDLLVDMKGNELTN